MASVGYETILNIGIVFPHLQKNKENATVAKEKATMITQVFKDIDIKEMPKVFPY